MNDRNGGVLPEKQSESTPPLLNQPVRFPWWAANWRHLASWGGVVIAFFVGAAAVYFPATNLLRETHESYRKNLVAWEVSLRTDTRELRRDTQRDIADLRRQIEELRRQL